MADENLEANAYAARRRVQTELAASDWRSPEAVTARMDPRIVRDTTICGHDGCEPGVPCKVWGDELADHRIEWDGPFSRDWEPDEWETINANEADDYRYENED